jgi:hypothetical protein
LLPKEPTLQDGEISIAVVRANNWFAGRRWAKLLLLHLQGVILADLWGDRDRSERDPFKKCSSAARRRRRCRSTCQTKPTRDAKRRTRNNKLIALLKSIAASPAGPRTVPCVVCSAVAVLPKIDRQSALVDATAAVDFVHES